METDTILSLERIVKIYPGVVALNEISVDFRKGEIHAIVGENGAGKSTFIKVITGAVRPESGIITVSGKNYAGISPAQARSIGIEAIYQEYNLIDLLSAAENICPGKKYGHFVNQREMNKVASAIFERFKVDIDPRTPVRSLSSAKRQIVEIAKAVSKNAGILIMDEPTAPLTAAEIAILMDIVTQLKKKKVSPSFIYPIDWMKYSE